MKRRLPIFDRVFVVDCRWSESETGSSSSTTTSSASASSTSPHRGGERRWWVLSVHFSFLLFIIKSRVLGPHIRYSSLSSPLLMVINCRRDDRGRRRRGTVVSLSLISSHSLVITIISTVLTIIFAGSPIPMKMKKQKKTDKQRDKEEIDPASVDLWSLIFVLWSL